MARKGTHRSPKSDNPNTTKRQRLSLSETSEDPDPKLEREFERIRHERDSLKEHQKRMKDVFGRHEQKATTEFKKKHQNCSADIAQLKSQVLEGKVKLEIYQQESMKDTKCKLGHIQCLEEKVRDLTTQVEHHRRSETEIANLSDTKAELERATDNFRNHVKELEERELHLTAELLAKTHEQDDLQNKHSSLKAELERMTADKEKNAEWEKKVATFEGNLSKIGSLASDLSAARTSLQSKQADLEESNRGRQHDAQTIDQLREHIHKLDQHRQLLEHIERLITDQRQSAAHESSQDPASKASARGRYQSRRVLDSYRPESYQLHRSEPCQEPSRTLGKNENDASGQCPPMSRPSTNVQKKTTEDNHNHKGGPQPPQEPIGMMINRVAHAKYCNKYHLKGVECDGDPVCRGYKHGERLQGQELDALRDIFNRTESRHYKIDNRRP